MTRCNYVDGRLRAYLDEELESAEEQRVRLHLETCSPCRGQLDLLRQTVGVLRTVAQEEPPAHFTANLQVRLAAARSANEPVPIWRRALQLAARPFQAAPRARWGAAGVAVAVTALLLATQLPRPKELRADEIAQQAAISWLRVNNYTCMLLTRGVHRGQPREFVQTHWFTRPDRYRLETALDYRLVTVLDRNSVRDYLPGGDWKGRGPLLIVRPRGALQAALPFPFGVSWPHGSNATIDTLVRELRSTRNAELRGTESVNGTECYVLRFNAVPPGGRRPEECTIWIAKDLLLPLRIQSLRDTDNQTVTETVNLAFNTNLPSNVFNVELPAGALVIHGDVHHHVFGLKPRERTARFDVDPLGAGRDQVAERSVDVPFTAFAPDFVPKGYRFVRVRRSFPHWLDMHWLDDAGPGPARAMRLTQQPEEVADPTEVANGRLVNLGTREAPLLARMRVGREPYPHVTLAWRRDGALLTLATADLPLAETLKVARSLRAVPPGPRELAGPPAPEREGGGPGAVVSPASVAASAATGATEAAAEPPMMPVPGEDESGPSTAAPPR